MWSQQHECPQQQCTCAEVHELARLYRELKGERKRAQQDEKDNERITVTEELQMTRGQAEHVLGIVRTQREGVGNLMSALRQFSQKLSSQEEMLCQADKEIAELRDEMRTIKQQHDKKQRASAADATIGAEEVAWRQTVDSEIREQCRLKNKIKQLTECLECRRQRERAIDAARQEERRTDAKLLLNAMDFVERCVDE